MNDELGKLNLVELLDRMADIAVPEPVSYWPQTTGWLIVGLVLILGTGLLFWRSAKRRRVNWYRRQASKELANIPAGGPDLMGQLTDIARIVRRVALVSFPRQRVAALFGKEWLRFLEKTGHNVRFTSGPGKLIAYAPYNQSIDLAPGDVDTVRDLALKWIGTHRGETDNA